MLSLHGLICCSNTFIQAVSVFVLDTPMVQGPSRSVAGALGMVPMSLCMEAYIKAIEDTSLNGA